MDPCATPTEYLQVRGGRYFVGHSFIIWHSTTDVGGVSAWGRPDPASTEQLFALLDAGLHQSPFSLIDARSLSGIDHGAFDLLFGGLRDRQGVSAKTIRKQAILHTEGAVGATVVGLHELLTPAYPVKHFTALEDAVDWFGLEERARLLGEIAAMTTAVRGVPEIVLRLRAVLAASQGRGLPESLAKQLGTSRRTLQRRFESLGTSVRHEVHAYRVERAKVLLVETDRSIVAIAEAVGFESVRTLNDVFRKHTGQSPSSFRELSGMRPVW
jgi:AraC-like DNA-binding protein